MFEKKNAVRRRPSETKQKSGVFKCCSNWFILQGEKFRSEKVGMVSTFSQRIFRCKFAANCLISTSAHIFAHILVPKNLRRMKKFVSCQ